MLALVYVDDILVASRNMNNIIKSKNGLSSEFEIKDLGKAKYCLGLEVKQCTERFEFRQTGYIRALLKQYGMHECNSSSTPAEMSGRLNDTYKTNILSDEYPYRELIGGLMYISVATRPDIANSVSRLAQHVSKPQKSH